MTDTDEGPLVTYVVATYNRPDDLTDAMESIVDQDYRPLEVIVVSNSTDETSTLFEDGGRFDQDFVQYHEFPGRMGVPQARNVGYERASGDVIVTIDDDAVMADSDATDRILSLFEENPDVGALAFQCRDYRTRKVNLHETPDPPQFDMMPTEQYRATNFVGVGNAIRRSTLEAAGTFPDSFVYGFEEMDLSFRIHDSGDDILFAPSVVVYHKKSQAARRPDLETQERMVGNRIMLALRNLPLRYVLFTTLIWSAYGLLLTKKLSSLKRIFQRLYDERDELLDERNVVSGRTIRRIKSRNTMLFMWWYGPHPGRLLGPNGNPRRILWETNSNTE